MLYFIAFGGIRDKCIRNGAPTYIYIYIYIYIYVCMYVCVCVCVCLPSLFVVIPAVDNLRSASDR